MAFFGELGSGNTGNDGSFEATLNWVRRAAPDAEIFAICTGPEQVSARFGIPAMPMHPPAKPNASPRLLRRLQQITRKARTPIWTFRLLRDTDSVIVPGAGVLESTWHRPWMMPYNLYALTLSARARHTPVALVNVGADRPRSRPSRWLVSRVARRATYITVRDEQSATDLRAMRVDISREQVRPDLAFALSPPPEAPPRRRCVGVGLINYFDWRGGPDEQASNRSTYEAAMVSLLEWLLVEGYAVRLLTGDRWDDDYLQRAIGAVRMRHPDVGPDRLFGEPAHDLHELMTQMREVEVVIGARYHNIVSALRLAKPVLALSYAPKTIEVMRRFGLSRYTHPIDAIDPATLREQFQHLYSNRAEIGCRLGATLAEVEAELLAQETQLLGALLSSGTSRTGRRVCEPLA